MPFPRLHHFLFVPCRRKKNPAYIRKQKRRQNKRSVAHREALAEAERRHDAALEPATAERLQPLLPAAEPLLPLAADQSPLAQAPRPAINRCLQLDAQENFLALATPARPPSPPPPADDSPSPSESMPVQCTQTPMPQHAESSGSWLARDKVDDWLRRCASPESESMADCAADIQLPDKYPTPPDAPYDEGLSEYTDSLCDGGRRYTANFKGPKPGLPPRPKPSLLLGKDGEMWVRKDFRDSRGLAPRCWIDTGYRGAPDEDGNLHRGYFVYDSVDLQWARRLEFHIYGGRRRRPPVAPPPPSAVASCL